MSTELEAYVPTGGGMRSLERDRFITPNPGPNPLPSLFAGHVPGTVLVGFSAPADSNAQWAFPGYSEALDILDRTIYMHRDFTGSTTPSQWVTWVQSAHADNYGKAQGPLYPLLSFKCASYSTMRDGGYNTQMAQIRTWAKTRRTSGPGGTPQPFALTFDHEPIGNSGGSLTEWGQAHTVMSNFMAGWTTNTGNYTKGTYNADDDVSDILAWHCIPNGHVWGPKNRNDTYINQKCPQFLRETFMENRSIIIPDFYDPNPRNALAPDNPNRFDVVYDYAANADRVSKKVTAFIEWTDAVGYTGAIGCGEFSATEEDEIIRLWGVIRQVRDRWGIMSHFSSPQNSRWDWRLIPNGYPGGRFPDVYKSGTFTLRDLGGKPRHAARLAAMQQVIDESRSPQYTGPMGG